MDHSTYRGHGTEDSLSLVTHSPSLHSGSLRSVDEVCHFGGKQANKQAKQKHKNVTVKVYRIFRDGIINQIAINPQYSWKMCS